MKISKNEIEYMAEIARIGLTDEEKSKIRTNIEEILLYFDSLNDIDISGVGMGERIMGTKNVLRDDEVETFYSRDEMFSNAPSEQNGYFRVPRIME